MAKVRTTLFTAFYRPLRGYSRDHQRQIVHDWAAKNGATLIAEYTAGEHGDDLDEWRRTTRANEGAVVADLWAIPDLKSAGVRPTAEYSRLIVSLMSSCAVIVEARTGITSRDGERWHDAVAAGANKVGTGRERPRGHHRKAAKARWAKAAPGIVEHWQSPNMADQRERWQNHWQNRKKYRSAQAAFEALPEKLQQEFATPRTCYRIFGPRDPDRQSGGRLPKRKPRS